MSALHSAVLEAFNGMGWQYRIVPGMEVVECAFEAHHTKVLLHAQSFEPTGIVTVVSNSSVAVPRSHLLAVCELIMRNNQECNLGSFELQWDTRQVMFRTASVFPPRQPDSRIIRNLAITAVAEMDRFTAYLLELLRVSELELPLYRVAELAAREDLLPAPDEESAA